MNEEHPAPAPQPAQGPATDPRATHRSQLSDGQWHRMHPLTPLFRGGFVLVVVTGIIVANMRDRFVSTFLPWLAPFAPSTPGDPVDYVLSHNLILIAALVVLGVLAIIVGVFFLAWRFHTFRITDDDVEVRSGVVFRTHRRAPLDRVQGVNLTRPTVARLFGLAKLEVVGAGLDANVKLEYLTTANAETVRADILRLASGRQLDAAAAASGTRSRVHAVSQSVSEGLTGLIEGAEAPVAEADSVVNIPAGRIVASQVLSGSTVVLLVAIAAIITGSITTTAWMLIAVVPLVLGVGAYWVRSITRSLRYAIAPTPSGVRITYGLLTTVTEIIPPGRIHAVEVSQPLLWRPWGWWSVRINRLSGRSASDGTSDQFSTVLPVGARADVERVLRLILPDLPATDWPMIFDHGALGPGDNDPYVSTPRRAWALLPLSWKRNGYWRGTDALFLRRGRIWRSLVIVPLARMQSIEITQGPIERAVRVANVRAHTVVGRVSARIETLDRDDAITVFAETEQAAIAAASTDRTHRWAREHREEGHGE